MTTASRSRLWLLLSLFFALGISLQAQTTATVEGRTLDSSGAALPKTKVTAANSETGYTRSTITSDLGTYQLVALPVGDYTISAELKGFKKDVRRVHLDIGAILALDFTLAVGEVTQEVEVKGVSEAVEPTRTMVSSVIAEREIQTLPVNGRQFIDFALLAPGVTVGDTTSGSTDVIVEPVTKLAFAGQNIHYNFIAVDGADNISTASAWQKTTPSQEAVQEFRVINSDYSTEFGRAVGGIVNIITRSGTNTLHGSIYEYFRNDALDAKSILSAPGFDKLRQNQFGFTIGGPIKKDRTFFFGNYEGQRRSESPTYNSAILNGIGVINAALVSFGLPPENLKVNRVSPYDTFLLKLDHNLSRHHYLSVRYFFDDLRYTNISALNDGGDLPSSFRNNNLRDNSIVGSLTSTWTHWLNELHVQFAKRTFDFPAVVAQPHLEVAGTITSGINRGNPEFYQEPRFEITDSVTRTAGRHTLQFGGDFNWVRTTESFPLFYPFEATFDCLLALPAVGGCANSFQSGTPAIMFYEKFLSPGFNEPTFLPVPAPSVFQGPVSPAVRNQAQGVLTHTYDGFFVQDKIRATNDLTLNFGLRLDFETWPNNVINNPFNVDPRFGFAYRVGTSRNIVVRGGVGIFHGIIPSPLLMCQIPSCGGQAKLRGRESIEDSLNSNTQLYAFIPFNFVDPNSAHLAFLNLLSGVYPPAFSFAPPIAGVQLNATIVRFAQDHKAPYGIQNSLSVEFEPFRDATLNISYLGVRGRKLGSFFNANLGAPTGTALYHDSQGRTGLKPTYGTSSGTPNSIDGNYLLFLEADSRWSSQFDGLLVNFNKRPSHHIGMGASYTWSKTLDNGPNPSFVLIPQDPGIDGFRGERSISADHVAHRFVLNGTLTGPTNVHPVLNGYELGLIVTLESPHYFTKYPGTDTNGTGFVINQRVGIEPRNTFKGDSFQTVDMRLSRTFGVSERLKLQAMAEAFNLLNTVNVRFFNTVYGAKDFCPIGGPAICGPGPFFFEGSPLPSYGQPRAVFNPRQMQLALRITF